MTKPFQFKKFAVAQDRCAMKIGTDGILLGTWTSVDRDPVAILDIGAGTGLLSLMLAQRSQAKKIVAIEIDRAAYEQCLYNFEQSPWYDRLICKHSSLEIFTEKKNNLYDLIVCNPPFYAENYKTRNAQRDLARFQDAMPFDRLVQCIARLLSPNGIFSVIVPCSSEDHLIELAMKEGLYATRITHTRGTPTSNKKRSLIEFSFNNIQVHYNELILETTRNNYTQEFKSLTKDFYLNM